ncbi:TolC family protein [Occallatibacter riparius]|uniref:TolC family protein n=1 Tax=Occallatibacter riparius TaxID=1002689 RepID=A0A9J7BXJ9_9BACT|nr:TolC family protein [Occallatibacter riparius]UWZ86658.1 TolC family protein [Occallatibacter riparius]
MKDDRNQKAFDTQMNCRTHVPMRTRLQAVLAILLLQANLALAFEPAPAQQSTQAPPAVAPDTPAPTATTAPATQPTLAQTMQQQAAVPPQQPFYVELPHSRKPFSPYRPSTAPELNLANSPRLQNLMRDGKLYISLDDAIALAIENNLDLAYFRYNFPISQTDYARTKAGGSANGVNTGIVQSSTQGGFSGGNSGGGGSSGGGAAAGAGGIVTSTLGAGTAVPSFDPFINFKGFVDHNVTQEANQSQVGVPLFKENTIEGLVYYTQSFPLGTNVNINYQGERLTNNSPYFAINPELFSNFQFVLSQHLLAGFGFATNRRYMQIAKQNMQITDLAFRQQVIATVTQVENIYWDLVNAYQDEQIKENLLAFSQKTLSDDQKQLELGAIPAMQVMKDGSDVATSEGDLTVARATLRLNELLMKNAITKTDDPTIAVMPVIPLDTKGPDNPNATKSIDDLIAQAEKKRPDAAQDEIAMQKAAQNLQSIKSTLLPTLDAYGVYAGSGTAGEKNPNCHLGADQCASDVPPGFGDMFKNTFNYTAPEYQFGINLQINLRNRQAKADQFRTVLEYRQTQITFEEQKKTIRFDVRNSQFALQQAQARVDAAQKSNDLAQRTFDITKEEQKLGAKSNYDTLVAQHALAITQSALVAAKTEYEKRKVDIDRATGETLERMGVSIDDAKTGVVSHAP